MYWLYVLILCVDVIVYVLCVYVLVMYMLYVVCCFRTRAVDSERCAETGVDLQRILHRNVLYHMILLYMILHIISRTSGVRFVQPVRILELCREQTHTRAHAEHQLSL